MADLRLGCTLRNRTDLEQRPDYKHWMNDAGFEEVVKINYRWQSNQWSEDEKENRLAA